MSETDNPDLWYAKCTACDWRVEFDSGEYLDSVGLEESARKRIAGHSGHHNCTSGDHDYGPISDEHGPVLEVKTNGTLTFHVPLEAGDNPERAVRDALSGVSELRHADISVGDDVYKIQKY